MTAADDDAVEPLSPAVCEGCGKETDPNSSERERWVSVSADGLYIDVCDTCAESDDKLRAAFETFLVEYRMQ